MNRWEVVFRQTTRAYFSQSYYFLEQYNGGYASGQSGLVPAYMNSTVHAVTVALNKIFLGRVTDEDLIEGVRADT